MFYLSKKGLPCSLHLRLSTPRFSIRITSTVLSGSIPDFSPIHNCYLIVLQSVALASTLYHNYIVFRKGCKIATWYFFEKLGGGLYHGVVFFHQPFIFSNKMLFSHKLPRRLSYFHTLLLFKIETTTCCQKSIG